MTDATYQQTSYLGGAWTTSAQGRSDDPRYKTALRVTHNAVPVEQGSFARRSGSLGIIPTRNRGYAKLLSLESTSVLPYIMEFTDDSLRFIFGASPVFTNDPQPIASVVGQNSGALVVDTAAATGWAIGDDVMIWFPIDYPVANEGGFRGRVLQITNINTVTITLGDEVGYPSLPVSPAFVTDGSPVLFRIAKLTTTIAGHDTLRLLRAIPTNNSAIIVQSSVYPQQVSITTAAAPPADPVFSIGNGAFLDGPYAAMKPDTGAVSATSGTITFTPASSTFTANDIGRPIRLFSEPPAWASGTTYAYGALVKYNGSYWQSTQGSNTGNFPGTPATVAGVLTQFWAPAPNSQRWVWGTISAQAGSSCTVILGANLSLQNGVPVGATNVIPSGNGLTISQWQVGLWSVADGYPICGIFHEGRLFLSGTVGNRFDGSVSGNVFIFSPTDQYGNVNDNSAIAYTLNQDDTLYWMRDDDRGIIAGARKGEWLISASSEGEAMTALNCKARLVTQYKCAQIDAVRAGQSLVFAQRYKRHVFEYLIDSFSGRFGGKPLNDFATNFTEAQIAEIAYTEEPTPIVWARMADGSLAGATYRRISRFITEAPVFNGWHDHEIGDSRVVECLCGIADVGGGDTACNALLDPAFIVPDAAGAGDRLYMVTNGPSLSAASPSDRLIEMLQPTALDGDPFAAGWFADTGPGRGKHIVASNKGATSVVCTAVGGIRGQDGQFGGTESVDLGFRATGTPGVLFSATQGDPTRLSYLAALGDDRAVYFNGYSALADLPRAVGGSKNFLLSVWLNLTDDNINRIGANISPSLSATKGQGVLYGSQPFLGLGQGTVYEKLPAGGFTSEMDVQDSGTFGLVSSRTVKITGPAFRTDGSQWLAGGAVTYVKVQQHTDIVGISTQQAPFYRQYLFRPSVPSTVPVVASATHQLGIARPDEILDLLSENSTSWTGNTYNPNPSATFNKGWYNLLISIQHTATGVVGIPASNASTPSNITIQVYVNDTQICNGGTGFGVSGGIVTPYTEPPDLIMSQMAEWFIGGRMPGSLQSMLPIDGTGLIGAMTELYINTNDYLDLSIANNRQKFHTSDTLGLAYAPVDIGAHGQTPTGNKPMIYFTGGPSRFHLNRAAKNAAVRVVNDLPDPVHIVENTLGTPVFLDPFTGPILT